jgi:hypothetical protein
MYPLLTAPAQCLHSKFQHPRQPANEFGDQFEDHEINDNRAEGDSSDTDDGHRQACGADLFYEY